MSAERNAVTRHRPIWAALVALLAFASLPLALPAAADPAPPPCRGEDLVAKARAEQPEAFAAFEEKAQKVPNAEGLLWRIAARDATPSYLFGTMHATEDDLVALGEPVRAALKEADTVAVELADAQGAAAQRDMIAFVTKNGVDFSGKGLEGLSDEQVASVKRRLGEAGLPQSIAPMLKPWFLALTLQVSGCQLKQMSAGRPTVDEAIEKAGQAAGAKIVGLETVAEQLEAVSRISEETARRMVRDAVADDKSSDDLQATTLALYRARKVGWFLAMDRETFGDALDVSAYADFMEGVVDRRNKLMLERSEALIDKGGVLIAVGALHLPGEKGLVELLRKAGYTVEKVW
jgi:uncharacterized protein YbaP (TraB family)